MRITGFSSWLVLVTVLTMVGRRSASGGVQVAGSASTWSPERMSLTWWLPSRLDEPDERDAAPLGEADLLAELRGAAGHLARDVRVRAARLATAVLAARSSSVLSATSTALGTGRLPDRTPSAMSGTRVRETPNETPTPGYVVRPSLARAS